MHPPRCSFGLIKGAVLLPIVLVWHTLAALIINLLVLLPFLDRGYAALRL